MWPRQSDHCHLYNIMLANLFVKMLKIKLKPDEFRLFGVLDVFCRVMMTHLLVVFKETIKDS